MLSQHKVQSSIRFRVFVTLSLSSWIEKVYIYFFGNDDVDDDYTEYTDYDDDDVDDTDERRRQQRLLTKSVAYHRKSYTVLCLAVATLRETVTAQFCNPHEHHFTLTPFTRADFQSCTPMEHYNLISWFDQIPKTRWHRGQFDILFDMNRNNSNRTT